MAEEQGETKTATEEEGEELWGEVVELTQTAFREGKLAKEVTWQAMVMNLCCKVVVAHNDFATDRKSVV